MARSKFNIRQLDILSSSAAIAAGVTNAVDDDDLFIFQNNSAGSLMKAVDAKTLQNYFSDIDIQQASGTDELTLLFVSASDSSGGAPDSSILYRDSGGTTDISWVPSSNLLKSRGNIQLDSDGAYIEFGDAQEIRLSDEGSVTDALLLSGTSGTEYLRFGAVGGPGIGSSADDKLDLDAAGEIEIVAPTLDLDASSAFTLNGGSITVSGSGAHLYQGASTATLDFSGAVSIDSDAALTLGGLSVDVDADGGTLSLDGSTGINIGTNADVAIDVDSAAFDLDASGELTLSTTAGALLESSEAAADAVVIKASDASGGIDLIASGTNVVLSLDANSADFSTGTQVNVDDTTQSTSVSTGALVVDGGAGIAKNLYVGGNLVVQGDTTTVETTNMVVEDPIVQLGSASAGNVAADGDRGFVFSLSGSANRAFWWDHSASEFVLAPTTNSSSDTEISIDGSEYASLRVGALVAEGNVDLGNSASDTVTFVADVDSDIIPDADGSRVLGASGAEWARLFVNDIESEDGALDLTAAQINVSGNFTVSGSTADFYNLGAYANTDYASADGIMVRDASASTAKHMTFSELGQYLVRGTSETDTDSNGIQVSSDGVLSISAQEDFFVSGGSNSGTTFSLSAVSVGGISTEVLDNSLEVYLNGQLQLASGSVTAMGAGDYSISGGDVVMAEAIDANDVVIVRYIMK